MICFPDQSTLETIISPNRPTARACWNSDHSQYIPGKGSVNLARLWFPENRTTTNNNICKTTIPKNRNE